MRPTTFKQITFRDFFLKLPTEQRARFAEISGTTEAYIRVKLVRAKTAPRPELMNRLWDACLAYDAPFTRRDLLEFFYPMKAEAS